MTKIYTFIIAFLLFYSANAQVITQWNFNSVPEDIPSNTATGTVLPIVGAGTIGVIGGATSVFDGGGGSNDPATNDDSSLRTTTYPAQGTDNKTRGIEIGASTVGYDNIVVTWDVRQSGTSANTIVLQYSIDGTTFVDFQTYVIPTHDTFYSQTANLSAITGLNNNANAKFRIVTAFAAGGSVYAPANPSNTYAGGNIRFDMVTVSGMSSLPVRLVDFSGIQNKDDIQLNWQTSSETNHHYFAMERSFDGKTFNEIGKVDESFSQTHFKNYKFTDDGANLGKNYYRLNQFDLDGKSTLSKIIMVYKKENNSLKLSPNPATNILNINASFTTPLKIYNYLGIVQIERVLEKGENQIGIQNLNRGIYFAAFESGEVLKFIKN